MSTDGTPQLWDRGVPGQMGHRRLVAGWHVVRHDGGRVEGQLAGTQGRRRIWLLRPTSCDHDNIAGV